MIDRFNLLEKKNIMGLHIYNYFWGQVTVSRCYWVICLDKGDLTYLLRFDGCDWRRSRWTLSHHIAAKSTISYLHAFLQGLKESCAGRLHHVSSVYASLKGAHKQTCELTLPRLPTLLYSAFTPALFSSVESNLSAFPPFGAVHLSSYKWVRTRSGPNMWTETWLKRWSRYASKRTLVRFVCAEGDPT